MTYESAEDVHARREESTTSGPRGSGEGFRTSIECRVDLWVDDGREIRGFDGDGVLRFSRFAADGEVRELETTPVVSGMAALPVEPEGGKGFLIRSATLAGREGTACAGAWVEPEARSVRLVVYLPDAWLVRVHGAGGPRPVTEIEVARDCSTWSFAEPLLPPEGLEWRSSGREDGELVLEPADGCVYWLRSPGYASFSYRWERRFELGHEVSLERAAALEFTDTRHPAATAHVEVLTSDRYEHGRLLRRELWTGGAHSMRALSPGAYVVNVYGAAPGRPVWSDVVELVAGEVQVIEVDRLPASRELQLVLDFSSGSAPADRSVLLTDLDKTATWSAPAESSSWPPTRERFDGVRLSATWEGMAPGAYLARVGDLLFPLSVSPDGEEPADFDVGGRVPWTVLFVDADSGAPVEVEFLQWSWIAEEISLPTGVLLPAGGTTRAPSGVVELFLPPGFLRMILVSNAGSDVWSGALVDNGERTVVVEVAHAFQLELTRGPVASGRGFSPGYLREVRFARGLDPVADEEILIHPKSASSAGGRPQARMSVLGGAPTRVYLPALESFCSGGWISLPVGVDGARLDVETGRIR